MFKTYCGWVGEGGHAPKHSGRLSPSLSLLVRPPLALPTEKRVSTGRPPFPHATRFLRPWLALCSLGTRRDVPAGLGLVLLLGVPAPSSWLPAASLGLEARRWQSKEREGLNLALPSERPANKRTTSGSEFH